jgi:hypothetical protein
VSEQDAERAEYEGRKRDVAPAHHPNERSGALCTRITRIGIEKAEFESVQSA